MRLFHVVPHWPTGMHLGVTVDVDGMRCQVDWAPPNHHKPSRCFWVLRTDVSQDGVLDGLGSMVVPSNCLEGWPGVSLRDGFSGVFFGFLCMIWPPLTTVPFVPVWPVASNLPNVLYNLAKGPIVKCIGVVFLQEFAIVQLIFFDMPLIYDKSGLSHSRLHCDLTGIMVRRGNYPHVRPYFQWGIVIIPVRRGNYHELSQSSLIPNYPNTLFQVGELSLYFAQTHAIFSHHQEDFSARKCARMLGLRPRWKYAVRHRCTCFLTGWWFGTMEPYDFPYIGNVIIPTDELIFFKWVGIPPTS